MKHLQNLALAICGLVGSLGSEGPALFTARTRNWYWFPSFNPGTRASKAGVLREEQNKKKKKGLTSYITLIIKCNEKGMKMRAGSSLNTHHSLLEAVTL